jgi:hypothetical protein
MNRYRNYATLAALCWLLAACVPLGLERPTEFPDRVAYAYSNVDGAVTAATNALNAKTIGSADAKFVRDTAVNARTLLVAAETAFGDGDISTAEGRLNLAEGVLRQLQAYTAKGAKP